MSKNDYYSEVAHGPHEIFELGNYQLESGITLPNARIAYKTRGTLSAAKENVVLFPHMWSGTPKAMEIFIGDDRPLDPRRYFIILPGQFPTVFHPRLATRRRRSMEAPSRMSPSVTMSWRSTG
jgi:homoserine O-acetyltransferase